MTDPDPADDPVGANVSLTSREDGPGLVVRDHVERHRFELWTDEPVAPAPAGTDQFRFPTDAAVALHAAGVTVPTVVEVYVRDAEGEMLAAVDRGDQVSFGPGTYDIEVCAPMKIYLRAEGPVSVEADALRVRVAFEGERRVLVGGRSHHERPAATVRTTGEPRDVMDAVSTFGSALKTTSVERSYPTLRGHPPLVELADQPAVPAGVDPPDTGVTVAVPPDLGAVYVVAPLAYYLGATVEPTTGEPRLVTDRGLEASLDGPDGFEEAVRRTLQQTFLFDCLVRTEGYYQVDLHERRVAESRLGSEFDLDFASLYDAPLAARLAAYLEVPFERVADLVPDWGLETHVRPAPEHAGVLPFVTDDLAVVRTADVTPVARSAVQSTATNEFFRSTARSGSEGGDVAAGSFVGLPSTDAVEQAWVGEGTPVGATKALPEAFHNRLSRSPVEGEIAVTVVCNDRAMTAESDVVDRVYGSSVDLPFDVTVRERLGRAALRDALERDIDFLHYVGHIDDRGFECRDGWLDAESVDHVGVDAFLLNACRSYEQGAELVRAGAVGGIVTLSDVLNDGAVRVGKQLARLLNRGFPLTGALDVARAAGVSDQYVVVGDGRSTLARTEGGPPNAPVVTTLGDDAYRLAYHAYPTTRVTTGSMVRPLLGDDEHYLFSGHVDTFDLDGDALADFLSLETVPVRFDGDLRWSDDVDLDAL